MSKDKSLAARNGHFLLAISVDHQTDTVDLIVFDHDTGSPATLYMSPAFAEQLADLIIRHAQSLRES